jgi:gluconate 2-dehydrogenase gamma chain
MEFDRRGFLVLSGSALASFWLSGDPKQVREALGYARRVAEGSEQAAWQYFTPAQAADVEAITSQIIPSDETPGAKEAGVVYFLDRSLATWASDQREPLTKGLDALNADVAKRWPGTARFANLSPEKQTQLLKDQEKTPFFQAIRAGTMMGFFSDPSYGGNRNKVGWQLLQFDDRYAWQPPFGDYDRAAKGR